MQPISSRQRNLNGIFVVTVFGGLFLLILSAATSSNRPLAPQDVVRGNLIIAIESITYPDQRLSIYRERHYEYNGSQVVEPAQAFFDRNSHSNKSKTKAYTYTLSAEEWHILDSWQIDWCSHDPATFSAPSGQATYRVALRCDVFRGSLFITRSQQLPVEVQNILRHATNNAWL